MPTYRLTLAYDGTDFAGWQAQRAGGARTVQGTLEDALSRLTGGARIAVTHLANGGRRQRDPAQRRAFPTRRRIRGDPYTIQRHA